MFAPQNSAIPAGTGSTRPEIALGLCGDSILKNLDGNPSFAHPQQMAVICAILPFLLGAMGAVIAHEATPRRGWSSTPLSLFCLGLCPIAVVSAFLPRIFKWDWRTKYFGFSAIHFSSASLLGLIPWLAILLYGRLSPWENALLLIYYIVPNVWWCYRFVSYYRRIYSNPDSRDMVYVEESDAVYYCQKNDNWLIEKKYKFKIFPSSLLIVGPLVVAFLLVPWAPVVKAHIGLPFPHAFLAVACLPIVMMVLGLTTKCYLVFYRYPRKITLATGKAIYVDMVTRTIPLRKR
jgi:hypothetical protein